MPEARRCVNSLLGLAPRDVEGTGGGTGVAHLTSNSTRGSRPISYDRAMSYANIRVDVSDAIATVTIDRPAVRNALDLQTVSELRTALQRLAVEDDAGVVIITGGGDRAFVSGADVNDIRTRGRDEGLAFLLLHDDRALELDVRVVLVVVIAARAGVAEVVRRRGRPGGDDAEAILHARTAAVLRVGVRSHFVRLVVVVDEGDRLADRHRHRWLVDAVGRHRDRRADGTAGAAVLDDHDSAAAAGRSRRTAAGGEHAKAGE
jgi:hypothetical protein